MSKALAKIKENLKEALEGTRYNNDYKLATKLIEDRNFEDLNLLLLSIKTKDLRRSKLERLPNYHSLLTAITANNYYLEALGYNTKSENYDNTNY